ncbi:Protein F59C6.8 [Aphelenchoides avenae]|nr:Protein F59C6.8 [Aphelenchus avenae]
MLTEIYEYMKVYERLKLVELEPWAKVVLDEHSYGELGYDPNGELTIGNQPTAYNDCLLRFKSSADFIMFGDTDDILFPRMGGTYLEELRHFSSMYPSAGAFLYPRFNANFLSSRTPGGYSLAALISKIKITKHWVSQKYVAIPSRVKSAYIHWPQSLEDGYNMTEVPAKLNVMLHLRKWRTVDRYSGALPHYLISAMKTYKKIPKHTKSPFKKVTGLITKKRINALEAHFRTFLEEHARKEFSRLPGQVSYYPILERCIDSMLYSRKTLVKECIGHIQCDMIPTPGNFFDLLFRAEIGK